MIAHCKTVHAGRTKAALAAVEGIPTKALEGGVVQEMIEVLRRVVGAELQNTSLCRDSLTDILAKLEGKEEER